MVFISVGSHKPADHEYCSSQTKEEKTMRFWMIAAALLSTGCDKEEEDSAASPEADADTDTDADADADADADTDTDPNLLTLPVTDARYECEGWDTGVSSSLSSDGGTSSGTAAVAHLSVESGCCPTMDISAVADIAAGEVAMTYNLSKDDCDCLCTLDLYYTLTELPSGTWQVSARGDTTEIVIP